jgi:hypothetical protein
MNLTTAQLTKLGIALGACFAVYKFVPNQMAKTAAVAVGGVIVARNVPYVGAALGA